MGEVKADKTHSSSLLLTLIRWKDEEDSAARYFIFSSVIWLVLVVSVALILVTKLVWPDFLGNTPWLSFGRLRPVHVNVALFGWLSMSSSGIMLYILPRLTGVKLYSERLGNLTCSLWNLLMFGSTVSLLLGYTQGREYAEFILPLDFLLMLNFTLLAYNAFKTVAQMKERVMYVSLWYFLGSLVWVPITYVVGNNFLLDTTGLGGRGPVSGVNDAMLNWWYGHNLIGMWFSTMGLGTFFYFLPVFTGNPLYSHRLSLIGFWTLAFFYVWNGQHHLVYGPGPDWLENVAITFSILMLIPVFAVVYNLFKTTQGKWHLLFDSSPEHMPFKFFALGGLSYFLTCTQGPFQAIKTVNAGVHLSYWVVGHAHLAFLATFTTLNMSAIYHILRKLLNVDLNLRLTRWNFWLLFVGTIIFLGITHAASIVQSTLWLAKIEEYDFISGTTVSKPVVEFIDIVRLLHPYYFTWWIGAGLAFLGVILFVINVLLTFYRAGRV